MIASYYVQLVTTISRHMRLHIGLAFRAQCR